MKKALVLLVFVTLFGLSLWAQVSLNFSPRSIQVNELKPFDFDPISPQEQPQITTLTITNTGAPEYIKLEVRLKWNETYIIKPAEVRLITREPLGNGQSIIISNRDLITEEGGLDLRPDGSINIGLMDVLDQLPELSQAAMAGFFPDGTLKFEVMAKRESQATWETNTDFRLTVRNLTTITLQSPGKPIGQMPPVIGELPVNYFWHALATGFNDHYLQIKEFAPLSPPQTSNIASTGRKVYDDIAESGFNQYMPLNDGYYYAWKVYSPLFGPTSPKVVRRGQNQPKKVESNWYVFRYVAHHDQSNESQEVQAMLNTLNNSTLATLLNLGYTPTGEVVYQGKSYSGQEAINILNTLLNQDIEVQLLQ